MICTDVMFTEDIIIKLLEDLLLLTIHMLITPVAQPMYLALTEGKYSELQEEIYVQYQFLTITVRDIVLKTID